MTQTLPLRPGLSRDTHTGEWIATRTRGREEIVLGRFYCEEDALNAQLESCAEELYGARCVLARYQGERPQEVNVSWGWTQGEYYASGMRGHEEIVIGHYHSLTGAIAGQLRYCQQELAGVRRVLAQIHFERLLESIKGKPLDRTSEVPQPAPEALQTLTCPAPNGRVYVAYDPTTERWEAGLVAHGQLVAGRHFDSLPDALAHFHGLRQQIATATT
ncbi:MAG TPA: hypothetical protein VF690_13025 [Hymenobacter sp.]|jgi:hypothetical protein